MQWATHHNTLCLVTQWACLVKHIQSFAGTNENTNVSTIWHHGNIHHMTARKITDALCIGLSIFGNKNCKSSHTRSEHIWCVLTQQWQCALQSSCLCHPYYWLLVQWCIHEIHSKTDWRIHVWCVGRDADNATPTYHPKVKRGMKMEQGPHRWLAKAKRKWRLHSICPWGKFDSQVKLPSMTWFWTSHFLPPGSTHRPGFDSQPGFEPGTDWEFQQCAKHYPSLLKKDLELIQNQNLSCSLNVDGEEKLISQ